MEELNDEQLREVEEQLYSQAYHHGSTQQSTLLSAPDTAEVHSGYTENTEFLANRYWDSRNELDKTPKKQRERFARSDKPVKGPEKRKEHTQPRGQKEKEKKFRNPFSSQNQNSLPKNVQANKMSSGGPFARQEQQLQRAMRYENKKQKSKNARLAMTKRPKNVATVVLDSSDEEDVIVVPLPPVPIYSVDDSDEDEDMKKSSAEGRQDLIENPTTNAFITPKSKKAFSTANNAGVNGSGSAINSRCNSPNSVLSQDDFIGQNDQQRVLKAGTIADDSDLLILTQNGDSLLEPPPPPLGIKRNEQESTNEIECIGTFIKPTTAGLDSTPHRNIKNCYRVDQSGIRAMDVYESESDIVSDGVYSKGLSKTQTPTTIRYVANSSDSEMDCTTIVQSKTKRLRKRRASGSLKESESNDAPESSDSDDGDGVAATGIPFIARGPAVESCKSKRFRKRTVSSSAGQGCKSDHMPDSKFMATLNSLAQGSNNNESIVTSNEDVDSETENFPSARDIAEAVISQQQTKTSTSEQPAVEELQSPKVASLSFRARTNSEEAVPAEVADKVEKLFDKINELKAQKAIEVSDEDHYEDRDASHVKSTSDDSIVVPDKLSSGDQENDQEADLDSNIKYFTSYVPANPYCLSDGFGWDEEMRRFYNNSWGGENATPEKILKNVNRDKSLWAIQDVDRTMVRNTRDRREKCINCFSFGHVRSRCPKPRKPVKCYMCGEVGHIESRCPNSRCLRCGSKTSFYSQSCKKCMYWNNRICPICKLRGHSLNDCPDKWRRYHSTTKANVYPNSHIVYNKRRYCCFCGKKGHLMDDCKKALYRTEYPMISSEIKSHEKSYEDALVNTPNRGEIACRLLYNPNVELNFDLAQNTTHNKVYGRFLCSVGLGHLIGKQNINLQSVTATQTLQTSNNNVDLEQDNCSHTSPDQVAEISESTNEIPTNCSENLVMPPPCPPSQATVNTTNMLVDHDSDSNYSFSDHFEQPTTSTRRTQDKPLPDFISLNNTAPQKYNNSQEDSSNELLQLDKTNKPKFGISAKYVESYFDEEDHQLPSIATHANTSCEAKIYISVEHGKYFHSNPGQEYLSQIMLKNNLQGRLNKTFIGYALVIFGLPPDQEKLQRDLELKIKSLNEEKLQQSDASSKVPRNVSVLIRFLRGSINPLYSRLGNASDLCKRLIDLEKHNSKSSIKSAERVRKILNMIFLGQAGLFDGDKHLETLLSGLSTLINNFKGSEKAPEDLRNQIDSSWRMIFSSYHHKNYSQLLLAYLKIPHRERNLIYQRNIDPSLLGRPHFNVNVKNEAKPSTSNDNPKSSENMYENTQTVDEGTLLLNVISDEKDQSNTNDKTESKENEKKIIEKRDQGASTAQSNKGSETKVNVDRFNNAQCQYLLSEIAQSPDSEEYGNRSVKKESSMPSMFWSRESLKFLKQLIIAVTDQSSILERLQRINKKANEGGLSYNDYRSVIELYNVTTKINKK